MKISLSISYFLYKYNNQNVSSDKFLVCIRSGLKNTHLQQRRSHDFQLVGGGGGASSRTF